MKKNDQVILHITDIGIHGEGIGKKDGFPLFVKNALPGDTAKVLVTKVKKNYGYGKLLEITEPSADRVSARCPVAQPCGGCQLQELDYAKQLEFKRDIVCQRLVRIGGFDPNFVQRVTEPVRGMQKPWRYRNKAQYPVAMIDGRVAAGFYAGRTHHLIENDDCLLEPQVNSRILKAVLSFVNEKKIPAYNEENGTGILRHIMIRHGFTTKEILLCLIVRKYREQTWQGFIQALEAADLLRKEEDLPGLVSVGFSVQPEMNNVIMGHDYIPAYGKTYLTDQIGEICYHISPQSFYQVNPVQMKVLYDLAAECAGLTGEETLWDLYCGIGTIGLYLTHDAAQLYGIEIVPEAVENARENARINGIENARFYEGAAEEAFIKIVGQSSEEDHSNHVVIVDPPRKGCDGKLLDTITDFAPGRIVYVSCDPATLARDLKILHDAGYELMRVVPVDQFCHSCHVETVVLMSRADR